MIAGQSLEQAQPSVGSLNRWGGRGGIAQTKFRLGQLRKQEGGSPGMRALLLLLDPRAIGRPSYSVFALPTTSRTRIVNR
jgi:hypothetical protein